MKKSLFFATALLGLAACSSENLVEEPVQGGEGKSVPMIIKSQQANITRATDLDQTGHYNFGVWAQKIAQDKTTQKVMENYLVGYGGASVGYDHTGATTWASTAGSVTDHTSPWFYENLGNAQYAYATAGTGFYTTSDTDYMSANANQYLRYWDLAYTYTNFYCYAPYKSSGVTATLNADGSATLSFDNTALTDGYENTPNSAYANKGRSMTEFMYAGLQATNADQKDIIIPFKHMGAQVFICFYENIPGYKVEIIDIDGDGAAMSNNASADQKKGVQATPAVASTSSYTKGQYYTSSEGSVVFDTAAQPTFTPDVSGGTTSQENLMFNIPSASATYYAINVPSGYGANLESLTGAQDNATLTHYTIPEVAGTGIDQKYAWSPTIYYPVAQPSTQQVGFTFHVSFRIIADDNKEVTTVHNATVHVPYNVTTWTSNTRYIYRFLITKNASGSTDPTGPTEGYDPTNPTPDTEKSLYPIVFDGATIEDYTVNETEHIVNQ